MRPNNTATFHTAGSTTEEIVATIDAANMAAVMNHLSDLYSDRVLAVTREYSTNAWDSHVAAGVTRPIEVRLPTVDNPTFEIQDFGLGLSLNELRKVYLSYGASDKHDSDELMGYLGFGSKSGTAYAPLGWNVTAIKNGERVQAVVAKRSDGVPVMHIMYQGPTTLPNGVTISIPVEDDDIDEFTNTAAQFFRYWEPGTILIDGQEPTLLLAQEGLIWIDPDVALNPRGHNSVVIMGQVGYPVHRKTAWGHHVIARVPMGSVEFSPSRESLKMTDLTQDTLDEVFAFADRYDEEAIVRRLTEKSTDWDRIVEFAKVHRSLDYRVQRRYEHLARPHMPRRTVDFDTPAHIYQVYKSRNAVSTIWHLSSHQFDPESPYLSGEIGVVTDYPYSTNGIAPTRRYHLKEWAAECSLRKVIVIPAGLDSIPWIDGWPGRSISWEQVKADYPRPKAERGKGSGKTDYARYMNRHHTWIREDEWDVKNGVILYSTDDSQARHHSELLPKAQVAYLMGHQVNKFVRLNPTAVESYLYLDQRRKELAGLITEDIKMEKWASKWEWLAKQAHRLIDEDILAAVDALESRKQGNTLLQELNRLSVEIPMPQRLLDLEGRYPLLDSVYDWKRDRLMDDLIAYMNAKYEEVKVQQEIDRLMADLESIENVDKTVDDADAA